MPNVTWALLDNEWHRRFAQPAGVAGDQEKEGPGPIRAARAKPAGTAAEEVSSWLLLAMQGLLVLGVFQADIFSTACSPCQMNSVPTHMTRHLPRPSGRCCSNWSRKPSPFPRPVRRGDLPGVFDPLTH